MRRTRPPFVDRLGREVRRLMTGISTCQMRTVRQGAGSVAMNDPNRHLSDRERHLWADFVRKDDAGLRDEALASLREFVTALRTYPSEQRAAWVETICAQHWNGRGVGDGRLRLRHPLLVEVIFPVLLEGYRARRANHARWLALFSLTPGGAIDAATYEELRLRGLPESYPPQLLREALELDPSDT